MEVNTRWVLELAEKNHTADLRLRRDQQKIVGAACQVVDLRMRIFARQRFGHVDDGIHTADQFVRWFLMSEVRLCERMASLDISAPGEQNVVVGAKRCSADVMRMRPAAVPTATTSGTT